MILLGAKSIADADGGSLYLIKDNSIQVEILYCDSLDICLRGISDDPAYNLTVPLYTEDGQPNLHNVVSYSYHMDKTVNIQDAYDSENFDFTGTKEFDRKYHYRSKSFLSVPLKNHQAETIGILQLINAIDPDSREIIDFDPVSQRFTEALASQAAIVLTKQNLISDLENLFETLVRLIAAAIDEKSPYTGDHCRRVPELTMMLAEAAHRTDHGYLKDFHLNDDDRYELTIAGWLHDCGKITTPEYVIDKATKLETIFDRIKLVKERIEILKRDKEIALLKRELMVHKGDSDLSADLQQSYLATVAEYNDIFDFIERSNKGSESMSEEDVVRLRALQHIIWTLNDEPQPLLSDEEIYNLSIFRGTLTVEERKIVNNHINATIAMLDTIKFPKHLQNVGEYAGGHHERIDGKGYPKGLVREEMSVQARTMAIADIFEALTAKDRPYKSGKKLSEALAILKRMKDEQHIDPDLYDAFIEQKVYMQYARKFLDEAQIDED
jgi:HD-GYP domain-containing protein (c-di-GMP phosphodiesterase class II)